MAINKLPNEIWDQILSEVDDPRTMASLARCDRRLSELVRAHGWRCLVKGQFHLKSQDIPVSMDFSQAARGLYAFQDSFKTRQFSPRSIIANDSFFPSCGSRIFRDPEPVMTKKHPLGTQTRLPTPIMDSTEDMYSESIWGVRKEHLAVGYGPILHLRRKIFDLKTIENLSKEERAMAALQVLSYRPQSLADGRDDIIDVIVLSTKETDCQAEMEVLVCRASSEVSVTDFKLGKKLNACTNVIAPKSTFLAGQIVEYVSVSPTRSLIATVNIAGITGSIGEVRVFSNKPGLGIEALSKNNVGHVVYSCCFLSETTIALGTASSKSNICVYDINGTGLSKEPFRDFSFNSLAARALCPLNDSSRITSSKRVFLSGNYDGTIKIHDTRSPRNFEASYGDPLDNSQIFSLVIKGYDQVFAGSAERGLLQCYDLRKSSYYRGVQDITTRVETVDSISKHGGAGWSIYFKAPESRNSSRRGITPIYRLSSPSAISPTIYASTTGSLQQFEFMSMQSRYPDLVYNANMTESNGILRWDWNKSQFSSSFKYFDHIKPNKLCEQRSFLEP